MDLRRRFIHALASTGAFLIVVGLSVGGGVAVAVSDPSAQPPADAAKTTASSSEGKSSDDKSSDSKSSDRKSSKDRKSKSGRGGGDSADRSSSADSTGDSGSDDSTATSATTTPRSAPTSTTTATTRPTATTATTAPPRPATTAPPTTASTAPATTETTSAETTGQYDGGSPYSAAEAPTDDSTSTTTSTVPVGRTAKAPASRSGAGLPPGIHPVGPGTNTPNSSNAPATNAAPVTPVVPLPAPVAPAESQRSVPTSSPAAAAGTSDPATATEPGSEVSGTETERGDTAARSSQELVKTGDATRRLIIFGGVALLMGAVVVAFTGREGPVLAAAAALPVGPALRPRPRKELDGWEDGVPLAPAKRELARNRLGISVSSYYDDELEV